MLWLLSSLLANAHILVFFLVGPHSEKRAPEKLDLRWLADVEETLPVEMSTRTLCLRITGARIIDKLT